jgi:hypothetical protein
VSDGSLALDGEADARAGGALGGERESSSRKNCRNLGILVAFVLQKRTRRGLGRRERKSKAAFSFLQYSMHGLQNAPGKILIGGLEGGEKLAEI